MIVPSPAQCCTHMLAITGNNGMQVCRALQASKKNTYNPKQDELFDITGPLGDQTLCNHPWTLLRLWISHLHAASLLVLVCCLLLKFGPELPGRGPPS